MKRADKGSSTLQLSKIARERNWLIYFVCSDIRLLPHASELKLSKLTYELQQEINEKLSQLRTAIDNDWRRQRYLHKRNT